MHKPKLPNYLEPYVALKVTKLSWVKE